ncbi:unnamed protein product, partial [marine sediment metagenome]
EEIGRLKDDAEEAFMESWAQVIELNESGDNIVSETVDYATGAEILTITYNDGSGDVVIEMRNRDLVRVTVGGVPVECDTQYNTDFILASDGTAIWKIKRFDVNGELAEVIEIKDRYTETIAYTQPEKSAWAAKILEFMTGLPVYDDDNEFMRGFKTAIEVTDKVMGFFSEVVRLYADSFRTDLTPIQAKHVSFWMPFINMLKVANLDALLAGGFGAISAWMVGQGSKIVNCAADVLHAFLAGKGISAVEEELAAGMIISDILTGMISSATTGDAESSLYSIKAIAGAKGVDLNALLVDADALAENDIALVESEYKRHIVMITATTEGTISYLSYGKPLEVSRDEFGLIFRGYILTERDASEGEAVVSDNNLLDLSG